MNIGPGPENEITINRLYQIISNQLKFNKEPITKPERVNEVKNAICSAELSERLLNFKSNRILKKLFLK